jgi:hypothetical protein
VSPIFNVQFNLDGVRFSLHGGWVVPAVVLALMSGWYLAELRLSEPSLLVRATAAAIAPLAILTGWALTERTRLGISRRTGGQSAPRRLYFLGSTPDGFDLPDSPADELRIAAITPIGAVISGATFFAFGLAMPEGSLARFLLLGIGLAHLLVAGINLLPAFPYCGGDALRAIFWHLHGKQTSGARAAFLYGQFIASAALGFGVYFLTWRTAAVVPGLWCLYFGWMILRASRSEIVRTSIIERADEVNASDAIEGLNPTIRAAAPLTEAIEILMEQKSNGPALVRDRNEYAGVLDLQTIRDIPRREWSVLKAGDARIAFDRCIDSTPGATLLEILKLADRYDPGIVIVRGRNGKISGLIDKQMNAQLLLRRGISRNVDPSAGKRTASQRR